MTLPRVNSRNIARTPEDIDEIYRCFLSFLQLNQAHRATLEKRGLSTVAVELHGYKSIPDPSIRQLIYEELDASFDLRGVPGFLRIGGDWHFGDQYCSRGFLFPVRNRKHQICGFDFSIRRPLHFPPTPPHYSTLGKLFRREQVESIFVTRDAFTANIASEQFDAPAVGIGQTASDGNLSAEKLIEAFPGLRCVKILGDEKLTQSAIKTLVQNLTAAGIKSVILTQNKNQRLAA